MLRSLQPYATKENYKSARFEFKSLEEDGSFSGYASVFTKDTDNDVIVKGAFKRTINSRKSSGKPLPILWQHLKNEPIGINFDMFEDDYGLFVKGQLNLDTQRGREARSLAKMGALGGLSIGFFITQQPEWKDGVRYIKEVKLFEYSFVTFPANEDAGITAMKGGHTVTKDNQSFNDQLALQQAESDLYRQRWQMEDALSATIQNIIGDGDDDEDDTPIDPANAVALIGQAYADYGTAMTEWWGKKIALMIASEAGESVESKEQKASMPAGVRKSIKKIQAAHEDGVKFSQKSATSHRRALDMAQQLVYSNLIRLDRNAPNPMPKSDSKIGNPPIPPRQDEHLPDSELKELGSIIGSFSFK